MINKKEKRTVAKDSDYWKAIRRIALAGSVDAVNGTVD